MNILLKKHFSFLHGQLKYLKLKSSEFLIAALEEITKDQSDNTLQVHYPKRKLEIEYHASTLWRQGNERKHYPNEFHP